MATTKHTSTRVTTGMDTDLLMIIIKILVTLWLPILVVFPSYRRWLCGAHKKEVTETVPRPPAFGFAVVAIIIALIVAIALDDLPPPEPRPMPRPDLIWK